MIYANFGGNRSIGGHSAAVQNLPFSHDFNGCPYNRQALTCCRDNDKATKYANDVGGVLSDDNMQAYGEITTMLFTMQWLTLNVK